MHAFSNDNNKCKWHTSEATMLYVPMLVSSTNQMSKVREGRTETRIMIDAAWGTGDDGAKDASDATLCLFDHEAQEV